MGNALPRSYNCFFKYSLHYLHKIDTERGQRLCNSEYNSASVTANITLAVALIFVSALFYKETITLKQVAGIVLCAGGLVLINF